VSKLNIKAKPAAAAAAAACRIFEEHPVQNFAVGDSIMTFDTMHT
jgi:hypothetical protein